MNNAVVRFDIGCKDTANTERFYAEVFGWQFADNGAQSRNIIGGNDGGPGGSITSLGHEPHQYLMLYIKVDDVSKAIDAIQNGGSNVQLGPLPTSSGSEFAWAIDPEGNRFAVTDDGG